jgi:hypothetical protein
VSTLSAKLNALVELELVEYRYHGKSKKYKIKNHEKILEITKEYQSIIKITEP